MFDVMTATATVQFQHRSIVHIVTGGRGIRVVRTAGDSTRLEYDGVRLLGSLEGSSL